MLQGEIPDSLRNLVLKCYCNLFRIDISRFGLVRNHELIWNPMKKSLESSNPNVRSTLVNLLVNLSIDLNERASNLQ
jgi:hypothetical protein